MDRYYICQLGNGKMLYMEGKEIGVDETGYPLPDCSLPLGNKTLTNQSNILRMIFGYNFESIKDFIDYCLDLDSVKDFNTFKYEIQANNIGGGCPDKVNKIAKAILDDGLGTYQAILKYILPSRFINDFCALPCDEDILDEYKDLINLPWKFRVNKPNNIFKNNIIMFEGIRNITDKHIDFIKDVVDICMIPDEKCKFNYISSISSENGIGVIILCDTLYNNLDAEYFYTKITGVDLSDGIVKVDINENNISIHFDCMIDEYKEHYSTIEEFRGTIKRCSL